MRSLSPSRILTWTSTVSPMSNLGVVAFMVDFSTTSINRFCIVSSSGLAGELKAGLFPFRLFIEVYRTGTQRNQLLRWQPANRSRLGGSAVTVGRGGGNEKECSQ